LTDQEMTNPGLTDQEMTNPGLTNRAIAVIFARGTGDAIPLISARLLAGKPMLHYTIQAAQASEYIDRVYVSTEDERIAAVARAASAQVIMRPEKFSGGQTPLSAAVEHAVSFLTQELSANGGHLIGLPADAIFCETPTIDEALEAYFGGNYSRLVALLPENKKYVIWRRSQASGLEPVIKPPEDRAASEELFSEPGVLTVWQIGANGLPDSPETMGFITVQEKSAFRVDTEYDLRLAERLLAPRHLALRCDGSREMGMGHISRMLGVADNLRREDPAGWAVRFFVGSDHLQGAQTVSQRGFDVDIVRQDDYAHWVKRMEEFAPLVIVNDLPFVPAQYTDQLHDLPAKSLTLVDSVADIEPGSDHLGTVVSLLDEDLASPYETYHRGPSFAPFHPSVIARLDEQAADRERSRKLRVLVAFGTGDPGGITHYALSALVETQRNWESVTVVVQADQQDAGFKKLTSSLKCPVTVVNSPTDRMGELLDQTGLALVSGGVTAYEASALGVPSIVLCQNQRELSRMEQFERTGSILLLGSGTLVTEDQLVRGLNRLADDQTLWQKMSAAGRQVSDGHGVERISQIVMDLLWKQGVPAL